MVLITLPLLIQFQPSLNMPNYIHSSPWQDAANFGGAIGDRLTAALIDMPLRKQQYLSQLLQQSAQMKMEQERLGQQQMYQQQQLGQEDKRLGIEQQNADATKSHYNDEYVLGNKNFVAKQEQQNIDNDMEATRLEIDARKVNNAATLGQERIDKTGQLTPYQVIEIGRWHDNEQRQSFIDATDKIPVAELGGKTLKQARTFVDNARSGNLNYSVDVKDPEFLAFEAKLQKHEQELVDAYKKDLDSGPLGQKGPVLQTPVGAAQSRPQFEGPTIQGPPLQDSPQGPTLGQPAAAVKKFKADPKTGQLIPIQ